MMRGQKFHQFITDQARQQLQELGWTTTTEYPINLLDGRKNFVDIFATRGDRRLILEIETTTRNVVSNVEKAAMGELPLLMIFANRKTLNAAKQLLKAWKKSTRAPPIVFLLLGEIPQCLQRIFPDAN
jgi:hypothetical protein